MARIPNELRDDPLPLAKRYAPDRIMRAFCPTCGVTKGYRKDLGAPAWGVPAGFREHFGGVWVSHGRGQLEFLGYTSPSDDPDMFEAVKAQLISAVQDWVAFGWLDPAELQIQTVQPKTPPESTMPPEVPITALPFEFPGKPTRRGALAIIRRLQEILVLPLKKKQFDNELSLLLEGIRDWIRQVDIAIADEESEPSPSEDLLEKLRGQSENLNSMEGRLMAGKIDKAIENLELAFPPQGRGKRG